MVHSHSNSIISGVFYSKIAEKDKICFYDPNLSRRMHTSCIELASEFSEASPCMPYSENQKRIGFVVFEGDLILFPSWLAHSVVPNEIATQDRLSISFNVFAKGTFGNKGTVNELIL